MFGRKKRAVREAVLAAPNLAGCDLSGASLRTAFLTGAVLSGASLVGTDFTGAYLIAADLTGAKITDALLPQTVTDVPLHDTRKPVSGAAAPRHIRLHHLLRNRTDFGSGQAGPSRCWRMRWPSSGRSWTSVSHRTSRSTSG